MAWEEIEPIERTYELNDGTDVYRVKVTVAGVVTLFKFVDGSFQQQGSALTTPNIAFVKQLFSEVGPLLP